MGYGYAQDDNQKEPAPKRSGRLSLKDLEFTKEEFLKLIPMATTNKLRVIAIKSLFSCLKSVFAVTPDMNEIMAANLTGDKEATAICIKMLTDRGCEVEMKSAELIYIKFPK